MLNPKAQIDAQKYAARRRTFAFIAADAELERGPLLRHRRALMTGAVMSVLLLAAFGLVGLMSGMSTARIPDNGAVVAKGSGEHYVAIDGILHPALNLASALLAGNGSVTTVGAAAIVAAPKGTPIGIPGAPDSLPAPNGLSRGAWSVCLAATGSGALQTHLVVGAKKPAPVAAKTAVLVQDSMDVMWLLAADGRYRVPTEPQAVFGLSELPGLHLRDAILGEIPIRATIEAPAVAGVPGPALPFDLVIAPQSPLCLTVTPSSALVPGAVSISVPAALPAVPDVPPIAIASTELSGLATSITIDGSGALIRSVNANDDLGVYTVISDSGVRYPLSSKGAAKLLGYDTRDVLAVAAHFVELIPAGPTLDPDIAKAPAI